MNNSVHKQIKHLIEETNEAYENFGGGLNADYAGFASLALSEFKTALHNPLLTERELRYLIRKGTKKHHAKSPESCWSTFMADYITNRSNDSLIRDFRRKALLLP